MPGNLRIKKNNTNWVKMISENRTFQIIQGLISLALGSISIVLLVTLRRLGYPTAILSTFLVVGLTLIFTGDYLINLFKLPVTPRKQEIASDVGLMAYGVFYLGIAMSKLLQPHWITGGFPLFFQPIWIRRGLAGVGIVLVLAGAYGIYQLQNGQLPEKPSE